MATYYKYAERSAEDYVDWGAIGKTMSDTLLKEQENRNKMKADIDKASREFGEVLSKSPQGQHDGMNKYALDFASNAQQFQLMQLKNLKAGKLSLKDYLVGRENVKQGANDAFDIIKKYNDKYGEYQQRLNDGVSSGYESFLLGEVEGFGNLTKSSLYINPTNGAVSAAFRQTQDPSKPYDPVDNPYTAKMETDPNSFRSLVDLNFALSAQIDKYDAQGAIKTIANSYAKAYQVVTERGPRGAFVVEDDITLLGQMSYEDIKKNFKKAKDEGYEGTFEEYSSEQKSKSDFADTLNQAIKAEFKTNPIHMISTLVDYIGEIPIGEDGYFDEDGIMTPIDFTRNHLEANSHTILLKPNPEQPEGGTDVMDEDAVGATGLLNYMTDQIGKMVISQLNKKVQINTGRAPIRANASDISRRKERERAESVGSMLSLLRVGNKAQVKEAEEYFVNTTENFGGKAVRKLMRTDEGVTVYYANGSNQTFEFKEGGVEKTNDEWLRSTSSGIGSTDDFKSVVKGSSKYKNKDISIFTPTGKETGVVIEHEISAPSDPAVEGFNKLMSETGNLEANARKLGYKVTKKSSSIGGSSIVYYNVSKGDRETVLTSEAEIADFIKSDITSEEIQDLYKTGAIVGVEGNSMEGY
jgi:hypothetical protein